MERTANRISDHLFAELTAATLEQQVPHEDLEQAIALTA
jgi:hypothetical protein